MTTPFWRPAPVLVAGPCVLEDDALNLRVAEALAELGLRLGLRVIYKASYDKANRSRATALRGPGMEMGLKMLESVAAATGLPLITDVHEPAQARAAADVVDALQVPAFLCRQTDLLEAVGKTGLPVNIKKGQWMDPDAMGHAVDKVRHGSANPRRKPGVSGVPGVGEIAVTERGTFFGYGDLVVDMRSFGRLRAATGAAVLFDATHAVQRPGQGGDGSSGGTRHEVPSLLYAAAAAGADGFFIETHPDPQSAPSDSAVMWPLHQLPELVERAVEIWTRATEGSTER
jgi:2-dehydro-3-deoxyphosphooctonate aldolase (KDO 8-P synthase)